MDKGYFTQQEILSQPEAWSAALDSLRQQYTPLRAFFRQSDCEAVIFTGCGSTHYLSLAAAALFQELTGVYARALPASEIWLYSRSSFRANARTLLIPVSRSGETTETLRAVEQFRAAGSGPVLTVSCYGDKPLAQMGDVNLVLPSGQEESIAQTRAFSVMLLTTTVLTALWAVRDDLLAELEQLPSVGRGLLAQYSDLACDWGRHLSLERFYFLGSGSRYGLAGELSLKMKEMSLSHSEPFHVLEFRHGPQSMVTPDTLIVGLVSESNKPQEQQVLAEMRRRGASVLSLGESDCDLNFASGLGEAAQNVLYLPLGQLMAYQRSLAKGLDPDRPNNLEAVVRLGHPG